MKQDQIDSISQALDEAYKALQDGDKDIAMACIVYIQTIINQSAEESHHPDCPAIDGFGCQCEQLAALSNPYTERGLEDRTKPIRALPTFDGRTDEQIANFIESN